MAVESQVANLQVQTSNLIAAEAWESAELVGSFMVNLSSQLHAAGKLPAVGSGSHVATLMIYADALEGKGETKRAIEFYKKCHQQRKLARSGWTTEPSLLENSNSRINPTSTDQHLGTSRSSIQQSTPVGSGTSSLSAASVKYATTVTSNSSVEVANSIDTGLLEAQVKFRIAKSEVKLGATQSAIRTLDSVPSRYRTTTVLLWMGKLYKQSGIERTTVNVYREALKNNPYVLEAAVALVELGLSCDQVVSIAAHSPQMSQFDIPWITQFIQAQSLMHDNKYAEALAVLTKLERDVFPQHPNLLTMIGHAHRQLNDHVAAILAYQRARGSDPLFIHGLDSYASLLRAENDHVGLNNLVKEMLEINKELPEPWIAVAYLCTMKGEHDRAAQFVDKAIELDPQHLLAYQFKGTLQLVTGNAELSVSSFYKAYSLRRDFDAYKGLVNAYLAIPRITEALRTAKEAWEVMPKDSRAALMVGNVLAASKDGATKAAKAYLKALKLNPQCYEAALAMADLYLIHRQSGSNVDLSNAIKVMKSTIQCCNKEFMHTKLAELYAVSGNYPQALTHYHNALSQTPKYEPALLGIERLEKLMRGIDPDYEEDTEVDDGGNDEYDQQ